MKLAVKSCFFSAIISLFLISCDDTYISSIPDYPVYLELDLMTTYPNFRNSANKYLFFEKPITVIDRIGFGGIVVYSTGWIDDGGKNIYYAFDMACPYEHNSNIKVHELKNDLGKVVCEKCGTVYDISNGVGNPTKRVRLNLPDTTALAKEVLKRYRTSFSGDILYITR